MYGYECSLCNKTHQMKSNIGKEHYSHYLLEKDRLDKLANERRLNKGKTDENLPTTEERLWSAIFGKYKE